MIVRTLEGVPIAEITACLVKAFANYFVELPEDPQIWAERWYGARVDYTLSAGMFEAGNLVGFVVHGIDDWHGSRTAFNCGTGVIPAYRGQHIVRSLYEFLLPTLKARGVQTCRLEVITQNDIAIKAYQSIGFKKAHHLHCFKGIIKARPQQQAMLVEMPISTEVLALLNPSDDYAWDNSNAAVTRLQGKYVLYATYPEYLDGGYLLIHPDTGYLAQWGVSEPADPMQWEQLFTAIAGISKRVIINNIYAHQQDRLDAVSRIGLKKVIEQYEMRLDL